MAEFCRSVVYKGDVATVELGVGQVHTALQPYIGIVFLRLTGVRVRSILMYTLMMMPAISLLNSGLTDGHFGWLRRGSSRGRAGSHAWLFFPLRYRCPCLLKLGAR